MTTLSCHILKIMKSCQTTVRQGRLLQDFRINRIAILVVLVMLNAFVVQAQRKAYACPMHPEVTSSKPGTCPKCKMDLRLTKAETPSAEKPAAQTPAYASGRKMMIPDVEVLDQDGNALHFYRDLIKDKTVAINFIFTNCTTICPPLAATFARVQKEMGDKVGKDVHFISISVDPLTDTPERLKAWGAKFKAGAGWTFVTGEKQ